MPIVCLQKKKIMQAVQPLTTSIKEKEAHWPEGAPPGKRRTSEDLEGGKPPPAPDQDLESSCFFKSASGYSICVHKAQSEHVIKKQSYGIFVFVYTLCY